MTKSAEGRSPLECRGGFNPRDESWVNHQQFWREKGQKSAAEGRGPDFWPVSPRAKICQQLHDEAEDPLGSDNEFVERPKGAMARPKVAAASPKGSLSRDRMGARRLVHTRAGEGVQAKCLSSHSLYRMILGATFLKKFFVG